MYSFCKWLPAPRIKQTEGYPMIGKRLIDGIPAERYPQQANQIIAAAKTSFLQGDQWA